MGISREIKESLGEQVSIIAVQISQVVPPTWNHVSDDPNNLTACVCAFKMAHSGAKRLSSSRSSGKLWKKGLMPMSWVHEDGAVGLLCPRKWKVATSCPTTQGSGATLWSYPRIENNIFHCDCPSVPCSASLIMLIPYLYDAYFLWDTSNS